MIIKTLDELREVDDRTLRFTPMGLGLGVQMRPQDAAEFQQQLVAQFELSPQVAEGTRHSFEALRTAFAHGVFCYEIFTLVNDRALLVFEQALRDRFVDHHKGVVTFVNPRDNGRHAVGAVTYQQMNDVLRQNRRWRLLLDGGQTMAFNGMLGDLRNWARRLGLLRGQRNRVIEQAIANLRNMAAHPDYHLTTPVNAARTLSDLAEIVNHLWGVATPGGRLYPAPVRREVVVLAWNDIGTEFQIAVADGLADAADPEDQPWRCAVVRAVFRPEQHISDPGLREFDSRFEVTHYPADLLWGPGSITDATAWFLENRPESDECNSLIERSLSVSTARTCTYRCALQWLRLCQPPTGPAPGMPSEPTTPMTRSIMSVTSWRTSTALQVGHAAIAMPKPCSSGATSRSSPPTRIRRWHYRYPPTQRRRGRTQGPERRHSRRHGQGVSRDPMLSCWQGSGRAHQERTPCRPTSARQCWSSAVDRKGLFEHPEWA